MGASNSQVDFYVELLSEILWDNPMSFSSAKSLERDVRTLKSRASEEGLGFLTKSLPKLGKALDQGLTSMRFEIPNGWKTAKDRSIPAFMQECFKRIFDREGNILENADAAAIAHVRQVCMCLYKLEVPYRPNDETRVIEAFIMTEKELELSNDTYATDELVGASYVVRDALNGFNHKDVVPRHGPGSVATGERLDEKWVFSRLYEELASVYPYHKYFMVGSGDELIDRLDWYETLHRRKFGVAKVVLVPKDSRGPRLISCEPLEFQWIQQGIGRELVSHLESSRMTKGLINFTDQEVNRKLALDASVSGEWATLDLKDASDRVSLSLVRSLFRHNPDFLLALEATRTVATLLPNGRVLRLRKYAPMGSALCFPIEALCFWAVSVAAISRWTSLPPSVVEKMVYVYGDDIIVKNEYASICMLGLERAGLIVNRAKSCFSGKFRESCGMDAYNGTCVTPIRWKTPWTCKNTDGAAYVAAVSFANQMAGKGYCSTADFVWKQLERVYGVVPFGTEQSSFPCRVVPDASLAEQLNMPRFKRRWNEDTQRIEFRVNRTSVAREDSTLDEWPRLLKALVSAPGESGHRSRQVLTDKDGWEYASSYGVLYPIEGIDPSVNVVPRSLKVKRGWTTV